MSADTGLQRRREELVLRHVAGENDRDLEAIMATFTHPRYEIIPASTVFDGDSAVRQMILAQWRDLPRMHYTAETIFHSPDGLVVETRTTCPGTPIDMLSMNLFGFAGDGLILERCYFDRMLFAAELESTRGLHK
ncbi:nuclear transport factor 2 family protein [Mycolicibacterium sp. 050232]|uniref:nuclear transport factor 2 family protein n=1 Tax=Mycolicibacterium sp. 050232 TaxID=3113982 RepID=UPI002E2DA260|nr:nuclear transport factor 2 family protein [Mycolicibacterium sp. 050232]MED5810876.1 nuclear transport factor 2 family protein [Mycolicibacterium sp. 050232]